MMNTREGVILSFKIIIDSKGNLMTELSRLPLEDVHKVFAGEDLTIVKKILQEGLVKLEGLHDYLESELDAFK